MDEKKRIILFSILQAFMICSQFISIIAMVYFGIESGFLAFCAILVLCVCIIDFFWTKKYEFSYDFLKHTIFIATIYLYTIVIAKGNTALSLISVIFYNILTYYVAMQKSDVEKMLRWIMIFSLPSIIMRSWFYEYITMGAAYALLPCLIAGMLHFSYYRKDIKTFFGRIFIYICYLVCAVNLYYFISTATRGAIIACIFTLLVIFLNRDLSPKKVSLLSIVKIIFIMSIVLLIAFNYASIIESLYKFITSQGIRITAIDKFYRLFLEDDVTNGRTILYQQAIDGFVERPILGNGLYVFGYNPLTKTSSYPHNFVLQFLYDGGLIFGVYIIIRTLKATFTVLLGTANSKDTFIFMALAVCSAVVQSCFSGNPWNSILFWMLPAIYDRNIREDITSEVNEEHLRQRRFSSVRSRNSIKMRNEFFKQKNRRL